MKRIKYVGPFDAVDVPAAGLEGVERGAVVEVADELAESLLEQVDNWQPAGKAKPADAGTEG